MLKYSIASDEGSFSPSHRPDNQETGFIKEAMDTNANPRTRAKMVMKKRAKHVQKRTNDYAMLPPINNNSNTPQTYRRDVTTPYINNLGHAELESPYTNALGISRIHDVSTPYIMNSHFTKMEAMSPVPPKDFGLPGKGVTRVDMTRLRNDVSFSHESLNKIGQSPFIERKTRIDRKYSHKLNATDLHNRNPKLHIQSNQIGLVERNDRPRYRESRGFHGNEQFSIRKKIEQFRRWHEEQYKEKLKRLKEEIDNRYEIEHRKMAAKNSQRRRKRNENETPDDDMRQFEREDAMDLNGNDVSNNQNGDSKHPGDIRRNSKNTAEGHGAANVPDDSAASEHTWRTWRDVNDSYAYNDVNKYIQDNELMNAEKADWIEKWIIAVEKAMEESPPLLDEIETAL